MTLTMMSIIDFVYWIGQFVASIIRQLLIPTQVAQESNEAKISVKSSVDKETPGYCDSSSDEFEMVFYKSNLVTLSDGEGSLTPSSDPEDDSSNISRLINDSDSSSRSTSHSDSSGYSDNDDDHDSSYHYKKKCNTSYQLA